jgi:hypothetical protein
MDGPRMHVLSVIQHQPHRAGTDLRRELVACLAHGSTFSRVGASGKPGAVHLDIFRSIQNTNQELLCDGHPPTWGTFFETPGLYRLTISVTDDSSSKIKSMLIQWRGKWDDFDVE